MNEPMLSDKDVFYEIIFKSQDVNALEKARQVLTRRVNASQVYQVTSVAWKYGDVLEVYYISEAALAVCTEERIRLPVPAWKMRRKELPKGLVKLRC